MHQNAGCAPVCIFFFCFLSENNHETIISSHCLFPILFGLAELLGEVVWSPWQPPSPTWVPRTHRWLSSRCRQRGDPLPLLWGEEDPRHWAPWSSMTPSVRDLWETRFLPCLVPKLANPGNRPALVSPQGKLLGVGEGPAAQPPPLADHRGSHDGGTLSERGGGLGWSTQENLSIYKKRHGVHARGCISLFPFCFHLVPPPGQPF